MRVLSHPILGDSYQSDKVKITVDGVEIEALQGEPIAAALLAAGICICRLTHKHKQPRGLFCGIGLCTDCMMTVNGKPNVRTCIEPVDNNMRIETQVGLGVIKRSE